MSETAHLRAVITGLLGFAASEEEMLLAGADAASGAAGAGDIAEAGDERVWAAVPTVAHNTEFKSQQAQRLTAVLAGSTPPLFGDIDHTSAAVYRAYAARPALAVTAGSRRVTAGLLDGVRALSDADLLDPGRHPWLNGRTLWLQVIVRGFWHPTGHVGEYYQRHGRHLAWPPTASPALRRRPGSFPRPAARCTRRSRRTRMSAPTPSVIPTSRRFVLPGC